MLSIELLFEVKRKELLKHTDKLTNSQTAELWRPGDNSIHKYLHLVIQCNVCESVGDKGKDCKVIKTKTKTKKQKCVKKEKYNRKK